MAAALALAAIGALCFARPIDVQAYVLRSQSNNWASKVNPFRRWMQRPSYAVYLRFMGLFFCLFAAILAVAAIASH